MPLFTYNRDIPDANNDPSEDQPDMKQNTNSIDDLIDVDHYGFNESNGGLHRQVQMPVLAAIPPGLITGEGTLYTKTDPTPAAAAQLFYTPGVTGDEYQLTKTITSSFATFGTNTNYAPIVTNQDGGWTFLPGGLIFQYGTMLSTGASTPIVFPIPFPSALFSLSVVRKSNNTTYGIDSEGTTGFTFASSSASVGVRFYWMAIGN